jgi:hypothetical protein
VSSIWYAKSYVKRTTRSLLKITEDVNPVDRMQKTTEEYRRIKKRRLEASERSRQQ